MVDPVERRRIMAMAMLGAVEGAEAVEGGEEAGDFRVRM